jgi:hypothetical protein
MLYLVAFARKALGAREKEGLDNVILGDEFWCLASGYPANECKPESLVGERVPFLFVISATGTRRRKPTRLTVCFFVSCNRHWFNRVPASNLGIACLPSALPLTMAVPTPGPADLPGPIALS